MEDRQLRVLMRLLRYYESTIHSSDVNFQLKSHPDFGTLKGTSETLESLGIINTPVRIERNEFEDMDFPFLGYIQENGHQNLIFIESSNSDSVTYTERSRRLRKRIRF